MTIRTLLQEIYAAGLTDTVIGERVNAPQSIITRLRNGNHKSTSYERGQKIAALHMEVVSNKRAGDRRKNA